MRVKKEGARRKTFFSAVVSKRRGKLGPHASKHDKFGIGEKDSLGVPKSGIKI